MVQKSNLKKQNKVAKTASMKYGIKNEFTCTNFQAYLNLCVLRNYFFNHVLACIAQVGRTNDTCTLLRDHDSNSLDSIIELASRRL